MNNNLSQQWTTDIEILLQRWLKQIHRRKIMHQKNHTRNQCYHYSLGIPSAIASAFASAGMFTSLNDECDAKQWVLITNGTITAITTILSTIITLFSFGARAADHKSAADGYDSLYRTIETLIRLPRNMRGDEISTLQTIQTQFDSLTRTYPSIDSNDDLSLPGSPIQYTTRETSISHSKDIIISPRTDVQIEIDRMCKNKIDQQ